MEINYYDYNSDFLKEVVNNNFASVYVFSNYRSKIRAKKMSEKPFLEKESIFLTLNEFKEKLSPTSKLILREEKLTTIFYELLTKKEKDILKINDYFDAIEISSKFYNFFSELEAYHPQKNLDSMQKYLYKNIDLKDWQKEKFEIFFAVRKRYFNYMKKRGFIDQNSAFSKNNFSANYFVNYDKISFVNKLYFTEKEKEILKFLEDKGFKVELNLQLRKEDFSEEELQLKKITLPAEPNNEIKLYHLEEELLQIINVIIPFQDYIDNKTEDKFEILDVDFKNDNYNKFLNKELVEVDKNISFTETAIFRFLNYLNKIFNSSDRKKGYLRLDIGELLKAIHCSYFISYYNISSYHRKGLLKLKNNNYVYLTEDLLKREGLDPYLKILEDIKSIEKISTLSQFIKYLENINLKKLNDKKLKDNIDVYYSSLHELKALEKMGVVSKWSNYFKNTAQGLFRFILNYLRYKEVKEFSSELNNKSKFKITDLFSVEERKRNKVAVINASSDNLASKTDDFILDNQQLEDLGIKSRELSDLERKYYFMRHILNSEKAYVFTLLSLEDNIAESAFMEELSLKYNIDIEEPLYSSKDFNEIIGQIFKNSGTNLQKFSQRQIPANFSLEKLLMEKGDFSEKSSLSYYRYKMMKTCQYRYYLEYIVGLEESDFEVERQMSVMVFGSLVHEIFAELIEKSSTKLELNDSNINQIVDNVFARYTLKVNSYYEKYYNDILLTKVKESAEFFLNQLRKILNTKVEEFLTELSAKDWRDNQKVDSNDVFFNSEFTDFFLNGRVDLLAKGEKENYIIDFKTGGSDTDQLDLYELMLSNNQEKVDFKKMIYNVMEEKFKKSYNSKEKFATDLKEVLSEFMAEKIYRREYKSRCKRCPYTDICKVVIK